MVQNADVFVLRLMVFALSLTNDQVEIISIGDYPVSLNRADLDGATLAIPFDSAGEKVLMLAMGISYLKGNIASGNRKYIAWGITHCWHLKDGIEVYFKPELLVAEDKIVEEMGKLKWKSC